jgi:glycosyltransferase involved in cell wall biosynthesis
MKNNIISTVLLTNIPAPYRESMHEIVSKKLKGKYTVLYCDQKEPNRDWTFSYGDYKYIFLKRKMLTYKGRYIHINTDVWKKLNRLNPDVVITAGSFNPTMLIAFFWSIIKRKKHIPMTDGWLRSESTLTIIHHWVRKIVFKYSDAYIGASKHSLDLYKSYGCSNDKLFQSHLCANNELFHEIVQQEKKYDLMFSGQFIERKMPLFFAEVAQRIKAKRGKCSVLILGSGELKDEFLAKLEEFEIETHYAGYVSQNELPQYYASAKIFLFPTLQDPWGVVANEAMAAGTPVITCENAGVAGDLVIHDVNGHILPLNVDIWAEKTDFLLNNNETYTRLSKQALVDVQNFSYENAAQGIVDAVQYTLKKEKYE